MGLNKPRFTDLLHLTIKESYFSFAGSVYKQIDGVAMGSPLGPILANIFLCHHEKRWLEECPNEYRPNLYRRYVDDTFLFFETPDAVPSFLSYMNSRHPNMKFTCELEENGILPFLGITITRSASGYSTSVYRKPTFTGLYSDWNSFVPSAFKSGLIKILLHRAYALCSTYVAFHNELVKLRSVLMSNGCPARLIDSVIAIFLNRKYTSPPATLGPHLSITQPGDTSVTLTLPFLGFQSSLIRRSIRRTMRRSFPSINFRLVFTTLERIGSRFHVKDRLPKALASNVVYEFSCSGCTATYVGKTQRHFNVRCGEEHLGISSRTGNRVQPDQNSKVQEHLRQSGHRADLGNFKIIS